MTTVGTQEARAKRSTAGEPRILVLNVGASNIKFALFSTDLLPTLHVSGGIEGIGDVKGRFHAMDWRAYIPTDQPRQVSNLNDAIELVLTFGAKRDAGVIVGVGHRVLHGGSSCDGPRWVTTELEDRLKTLMSLAPLHMPHNVAGIAAVRALRPELAQVACFDSAFYETLPQLAKLTALPRDIAGQEKRRYGFHGLSYEFVLDEIQRREGTRFSDELLIVACLGDETSMAAIKDGRGIETTMGLSFLAGLPTSSQRPSADTGELLAQKHGQEMKEAIDCFCARAGASIGSLAAKLGGLHRLVFTGGIGANAPVRERICEELRFIGVDLDPARNRAGERRISRDRSGVRVETFATDEEFIIARHTAAMILREPRF